MMDEMAVDMTPVLDQARVYMDDTVKLRGSLPEQGTDEFLAWADAFRADITLENDQSKFAEFSERMKDEIDERVEFLSGKRMNVDRYDIARGLFSYEVLTEEAL